jgi:hypothetical protein
MTSTGNAKPPINKFPGLLVVDVELVVVSVPEKMGHKTYNTTSNLNKAISSHENKQCKKLL